MPCCPCQCPLHAAHPLCEEALWSRASNPRILMAATTAPVPPFRLTGEVSAFYFDPSSSPDQSLKLAAVWAAPSGFAFPAYELA